MWISADLGPGRHPKPGLIGSMLIVITAREIIYALLHNYVHGLHQCWVGIGFYLYQPGKGIVDTFDWQGLVLDWYTGFPRKIKISSYIKKQDSQIVYP